MTESLLSLWMARAETLVWHLSPSGRVLAASDSHATLLLRDPQRLQGLSLHELVDDAVPLDAALTRAWRDGESTAHLLLIGVSGARVDVEARFNRYQDALVGVGRVRNPERGALFHVLAAHIPGAVYICRNDATWSMLYLNDAVEAITGYPPEDFLSGAIDFVRLYHPDDIEAANRNVSQAVEKNMPFVLQYRLRHRNGELRHIEEWGSAIADLQGEDQMLIGALFDVTEREQRAKQLQRSLREKEQLLQEVQHRINNNLTLMSGLLLLQTHELHDAAARTALNAAQRRLAALALTHRLLYAANNLSEVELGGYLRTLGNNLHDALTPPNRTIRLQYDTEPIAISLKKAVPCALMLNELITNALKHAFHEQDGTLLIRCRLRAERRCLLEVIDDGPGLPQTFSIEDHASLGMRLLKMLAQQLDATFSWGSAEGGGARFSVQFDR